MSRVIGVLNYKGGTGKTTTVVNLATGLSLRGARVLGIDLDAQGSLATHLGVKPTQTLTHLLMGRVPPRDCVVQARENLDLIASDSQLLQAEGRMWRIGSGLTARTVLARRMQGLEDAYQHTIVDFSPSASLLSENGLYYVHELIVPVSMSYMALIGLRQVIDAIKRLRKSSDRCVRLYLIVPTFYSSHVRQDREVVETLRRHFGDRVAEPIRTNVRICESPSYRQSIFEYAPSSPGAVDYARLVERVLRDG